MVLAAIEWKDYPSCPIYQKGTFSSLLISLGVGKVKDNLLLMATDNNKTFKLY